MNERLTDEQLAAIRAHVVAFDELGNVSVDELPYPPPQHIVAELNVRAYRLANDAPRLLAHIDELQSKLAEYAAFRRRVDDAEIAMLSDNDAPIPARVVGGWFAYIWHGPQPEVPDTSDIVTIDVPAPTEDAS